MSSSSRARSTCSPGGSWGPRPAARSSRPIRIESRFESRSGASGGRQPAVFSPRPPTAGQRADARRPPTGTDSARWPSAGEADPAPRPAPPDRPMSMTRPAEPIAVAPGPTRAPACPHRPGPLRVLALAAWLGLAAGWLEVGVRVLCRAIDPTDRLYLMSRHFVWLAPLANLLLFSGIGALLAAATGLFPRRWGWIGPRLLCALAVLPPLMVAGPRIHPSAWSLLALGIAARLVPWFERLGARGWRGLARSLPALLAAVPVLAGLVLA